MLRKSLMLICLIFMCGCKNSPNHIEDYGTKKVFKFERQGIFRGSCFYINHNGDTYFITAKHVLDYNIGDNCSLDDFYIKKENSILYFNISDRQVPYVYTQNFKINYDFPVKACGYDLNGEYTERHGYVCGRYLNIEDGFDVIVTTIDVERGMSGGALLDMDDRVLGITSQKLYPKSNGVARSAYTPLLRILKDL